MAEPTKTVLDGLIAERRWDFDVFEAAFRREASRLAEETQNPALANLTFSKRTFSRWRVYSPEKTGPRGSHLLVLESLFGRSRTELFSLKPTDPPRPTTADVRPADMPAPPPAFAGHVEATRFEIEDAARESTEHAALSASASLESLSLDQLHEHIGDLARAYPQCAPHTVHGDARRVRDLAALLLERTRRPRQLCDLYVILGKATSLLAASSFDLGVPRAALAQSRAAWVYGHQADHNGLCAWARGMEALIAYWSGRPEHARSVAQQAQHAHTGGAGTALVRLLTIEARAWAHAGNHEGVTLAIRKARRESERSAPLEDLHDHTAGEFSFTPARQERSHGTAYLVLGDHALARKHTLAALAHSTTGSGSAVPAKVTAQARVDLAAAAAASGDLDEAQTYLDTVLALPPDQRVHGINGRLAVVRGTLTNPRYTHSPGAKELAERIDGFTAQPPPAALPSAAPRGVVKEAFGASSRYR